MNSLGNPVGLYTDTLGTLKALENLIDLHTETEPTRQHPYHRGPDSRKILQQHIQTQLDADINEPSQTECNSPVILSSKKYGTTGWYVYFLLLNAATIAGKYPLSHMQDFIDSFWNA